MEDVAGFATTALPVVGAMLAIPPLSECARRDWRLGERIVRNLAFSEGNWRAGRWWVPMSYAFVHLDEEHRMGNVIALLPHASRVHGAFGGLWVPIFLGGAATGALDRWGKQFQATRKLSGAVAVKGLVPEPLEGAAHAVDRLTRRVAGWIAPTITRSTVYVGASAGVWALLGVSMCLTLESIADLLLELSSTRGNPSRRGDASTHGVGFAIASHALSAYAVGRQAWTTAADIAKGAQGPVDHAGHLDGFLFGLGAYSVLRLAQRGGRRQRIVAGVLASRRTW